MQQWNKSILCGSLFIAAAIVIAGSIIGIMIADNLGNASSHVPGSFVVSSGDKDTALPDYMSIYEAASYCRVDFNSFEKLLNDGKLVGTYAEIPVEKWVVDEEAYNELLQQNPEGAPTPAPPYKEASDIERVFIKVKLDEWMIAQVGRS